MHRATLDSFQTETSSNVFVYPAVVRYSNIPSCRCQGKTTQGTGVSHGRTANDPEAKSRAGVARRGTDAGALSGVPDRGVLSDGAAAHLPRPELALSGARRGTAGAR